jgi:hypothetical protein
MEPDRGDALDAMSVSSAKEVRPYGVGQTFDWLDRNRRLGTNYEGPLRAQRSPDQPRHGPAA